MKYKKLSIKDWALEDRPREKLLSKGLNYLSNAELLSIIIGSGTSSDSAVELAKKILGAVNNNLNGLAKMTQNQLQQLPGIGPARALSIIASIELGRRRNVQNPVHKKKISSSRDVFEIFYPLLGDLIHEEFWILLLNRSNKAIDQIKISQGGLSGTVIDTRIILKNAVDQLSSSLILCHNHPSGNLKPSDADVKITNKIKDSAELMDITVLDHIIVADNSYFSFADEGLI